MSSDVDEIAVSDAYMYTIVVCRGYTTALERGTHVALWRKQFCHVKGFDNAAPICNTQFCKPC